MGLNIKKQYGLTHVNLFALEEGVAILSRVIEELHGVIDIYKDMKGGLK
jgi:hypothetical protein